MLHVFAYLMASYFCVVVVNAALSCMVVRAPTGRRRGLLVACMLVLLLAPLLPYGVVEGMTRVYGRSLVAPTKAALRVIAPTTRIRVLKVLRITPLGARVYVVTPCVDTFGKTNGWCGTVLRFRRGRTGWQFTGDEDGRWSDCGSANGNVFPPYRSKGEYLTPSMPASGAGTTP